MNAPVKSDNPNVLGLKHMAFAVKDAKQALDAYSTFLCVPVDAPIHEYAKSRNRVAIFDLATAQQVMLGGSDEVDAVMVDAAAGTSEADLTSRVAAVLPGGTEALTGTQIT